MSSAFDIQPALRTRRGTRGARVLRVLLVAAVAVFSGFVLTTSGARAATPPTFVQQISTHQTDKTTVSVTPATALGPGNRLIVEVGVWSNGFAVASAVTDTAGDQFTELLHYTGPEHTEMSVWSAPVTAGAGTKPAITVKPSTIADVGIVALEYSGLSTAPGTAAVDRIAQATGLTGSAATVSSGATAPATADNEITLGFYVDSGSGDTLSVGSGYTGRVNMSPAGDIEMLAEDRPTVAGSTLAATAGTGSSTTWLMAAVVFISSAPAVPGAPTGLAALPGDTTASLSWSPPTTSGSPVTAYTVTPYVNGAAQSPSTISGNPPATNTTVTGLTNGSSYTFTVSATNALGAGQQSAPSNSVTPAPAPFGSWSALQTWPIMPLATHLLYNGTYINWDGWQQPQPSVIWNPSNPTNYTTINAPDSVFCDGAADLPDGRLLVVGGYGGLSTGKLGIVDTNIYDPATQAWSRVADMHNPRWYPTVTELPDGRYVVVSGNSTDSNTWVDTPEVYNPSTNTWTVLSNVHTSEVHEVEYPFSYEIPSGNVFVMGPEEDSSHILNVNSQTWTSTGSSGVINGSSVMYRPGKILYSGGAASINIVSSARNNTAVIDTTAATPTWRQTAPMNNARVYHTLTMLADGTVLAIGGSNTSNQQVITTGVMPTEIWDPTTETWTPAAPITASRNYHSTAILMPDGRVMVSGGGHSEGLQDAGQYSSQIFSPAYLSQGPRPTITNAPSAATYGSSMAITTPDASGITGVNLVSLGADTHQIDMNQHFVPLNFTATNGALNVQTPAAAALAPPGYYMLFILKNGVPSVASMVHLGAAQTQTAPDAPTNITAAAGDASATVSWAAPFNGNSPIAHYVVTPYVNGVAQFPTTVTGNPPATSTTITSLTNGTTYTFKVAAVNAVGSSPDSAASPPVTPTSAQPPPPTVPGAPTGVTAAAGNTTATVQWIAPSSGGSPITSYTVTPYMDSTALTPVVVNGSPPATSAAITGLTNGMMYTFTVTATNAVGTGTASSASNSVMPTASAPPAFVQQVSAKAASKASIAVTPTSNLTAGNRLVVEVADWSNGKATTKKVTDAAGDTFTELLHFTASENTELSVWTAVVGPGAGKKPVITATASGTTDTGIVALEYAGLSASVPVDVMAKATGATTTARSVSSGATTMANGNGLAIGFYADSGFNDVLTKDPGYSQRANVSPNGQMEMLVEDTPVMMGAMPGASVGTGPNTTWLMATIVFKAA
jgi:hypothetical protein